MGNRFNLYFDFFNTYFFEGSYATYEKALENAKKKPVCYKYGKYKIEEC